MRICVLNPTYEQSASPFADYDPDCDPLVFLTHRKDLQFESFPIHRVSSNRQVRDLILSGKYDLFFNLCDGAWDEDRPGIEVVRILEVPFTGADSGFYEPSKQIQKMVAWYEGVPSPAHCFAFSDWDVATAARELRFPLIVKHFNGYSSIGMTHACLCENAPSLHQQADRIIRTLRGGPHRGVRGRHGGERAGR